MGFLQISEGGFCAVDTVGGASVLDDCWTSLLGRDQDDTARWLRWGLLREEVARQLGRVALIERTAVCFALGEKCQAQICGWILLPWGRLEIVAVARLGLADMTVVLGLSSGDLLHHPPAGREGRATNGLMHRSKKGSLIDHPSGADK
jgi:hypothetical protein